jgi:hypothetical protein
MKKSDECFHLSIDRIDEEKRKAVLNINGSGLLMPYFVCKDCNARFYALEPKAKKKS